MTHAVIFHMYIISSCSKIIGTETSDRDELFHRLSGGLDISQMAGGWFKAGPIVRPYITWPRMQGENRACSALANRNN